MSSTSDRPQGQVQILLVEDAVDHALLVQMLLRKAGNFITVHCQDGDRAVELLGTQPFDLVITDLNLPGFDGFDLTEYVRQNHPETPVLVITGYKNPQYRERALSIGAAGVLLKPVDRDELLTQVRGILDLKRDDGHEGGVLAIGARPGDIELGCGGTLLAHRDRGEPVVVLLTESEGDEVELARAAAQVLGAQLLTRRTGNGDLEAETTKDFIARVAGEVTPHAAYIPPVEDDAADRRRLHRTALSALDDVPNLVTYVTATTGLDFRPSRFVSLDKRMHRKLEVLSMYRESSRRDLTTQFADAMARYWGRFADFTEVEPLHVLRSGVSEEQE